MHHPPFSHFGTVPTCDRQTDGWTHDDSIYHGSIASCLNNGLSTTGQQSTGDVSGTWRTADAS